MGFVDLEKTFDRVPRNVVDWALRKKGVLEVMIKAFMSLYKRVTTKIMVDSGFSDQFPIKVGVHQGSV